LDLRFSLPSANLVVVILPLGLRGILLVSLLFGSHRTMGASGGDEVVVVYNARMRESKDVAAHYADRRHVPPDRIFGLELPVEEAMTRQQYLEQLQEPLLKRLESARLFVFVPATNKAPEKTGESAAVYRRLAEARIRYAVLCYGVPTKILKDPGLVEAAAAAHMPPEIQRNEAAVDTQLALLPVVHQKLPWVGPIASPFYGVTNATALHPTNGILLVTRLDGPTPAIARGLVDKAIEAETNGLWGRAYFDIRGLATNDTYRLGDDFIRGAASVARRFGFETELDELPGTFTAGHPMSDVALYAGWYDQAVSGPFTRPTFAFMPGAFAYHLYSFSAQTIRSPQNSWVGTLLERGATCTIGFVDEPYLSGTADIGAFVARFTFFGFTFGEAAYAAQGSLSWQTTVIGDPLYRPFQTNLGGLHHALEVRQSKLVEWSHLLVVNRNLAIGSTPGELIRYIESSTPYRQSAVLTEKLGDLYWEKGALGDGVDTCETALKRGPSPAQRVRLLLKCAERRTLYGPDDKAYGHYTTLLKDNPGYPDVLKLYRAMLPLAKRMNNAVETARCEQEIQRLTPKPTPGG
jgi:uncharacterized protein (TIGR03790 family)